MKFQIVAHQKQADRAIAAIMMEIRAEAIEAALHYALTRWPADAGWYGHTAQAAR